MQDKERLAHLLVESAKAVHKAVKGRLEAGKGMDIHYDLNAYASTPNLARGLSSRANQASL